MGKIRTCENCLWKDSCDHVAHICKEHTTLCERRQSLFRFHGEWEKFTEEWDKARRRIRKYTK